MLKIAREGAVVRVSLDRPDVRNAFNSELIAKLRETFDALAKDDSRVVVLSGEGKVFCGGADANWMKASVNLTPEQNREDALRMAEMYRAIDECPKFVIGRIHGAAMGGGAGLAAVCDVTVAAPDTKFAFSEARLGIIPAVISVYVLPKIGVTHARRLFLTAEAFLAPHAKEIGLVHEVTADLDAKVNEIVAEVSKCGPRAIGEAKRLIHATWKLHRDDAIRHCVETITRIRTSPEGQEGLRAFLEKRPATWIQS